MSARTRARPRVAALPILLLGWATALPVAAHQEAGGAPSPSSPFFAGPSLIPTDLGPHAATPAPSGGDERLVDPQARPSASPLGPDGGSAWSVFFGYGLNQEINRSATGIDLASAGVRWSHMWSAKLGGFLRGHPAFAVEFLPLMSFVEADRATWAVGTNLLYEHHFAAGGRVLPVWKLGAGVLYAGREIPDGETKLNFSLLTALGVDLMVTETSALFLGYRFHHVSNANTGAVNPGINIHSLMFGLSFYR